MRRIGVMMLLAEHDSEQNWTEAFLQGLQEAGWTDDRNIQIDCRWGAGDSARARRYATETRDAAEHVLAAKARSRQDRTRLGRDSSFVEFGRNTQMAAGSDAVARAAMNSTSNSGTKSEVRTPETVAMWFIRR